MIKALMDHQHTDADSVDSAPVRRAAHGGTR
jgi:hypothetical protein